jgi:hypothetical protein
MGIATTLSLAYCGHRVSVHKSAETMVLGTLKA